MICLKWLVVTSQSINDRQSMIDDREETIRMPLHLPLRCFILAFFDSLGFQCFVRFLDLRSKSFHLREIVSILITIHILSCPINDSLCMQSSVITGRVFIAAVLANHRIERSLLRGFRWLCEGLFRMAIIYR